MIRKLLEERLVRRNYGEILTKIIMASLRAQQRYSTGRIKKRAINPREITLKSCHRKSNKLGRAKRGLTKKILWWEIGKRSRKRKQDKEMHACHGTDRL